MHKALLINVENKTITEIEIGTHFAEISKAIGNNCQYFCCPHVFPNDDGLYSDDEILLRPDDIKGGFMLEGWSYPIVNNAIILGCDDEGDSVDCKTKVGDYNIDDITWLSRDESIAWANKAMQKPFTYYSI
jgi:hypothetical protein